MLIHCHCKPFEVHVRVSDLYDYQLFITAHPYSGTAGKLRFYKKISLKLSEAPDL